ncbi:MAG TPA: hypothetical protein VK447_03030 [Myxococcaceae bacterium]|nr:hypothetical protein [Myxococcaceae bacterium]
MGIWQRISEAFGHMTHRSAADPTDEDIGASPRQLGYEDLERDKAWKEEQTTGVGYVAGDRAMAQSGEPRFGTSDGGVPGGETGSLYEAMSELGPSYDHSAEEKVAHDATARSGREGSADGGVAGTAPRGFNDSDLER